MIAFGFVVSYLTLPLNLRLFTSLELCILLNFLLVKMKKKLLFVFLNFYKFIKLFIKINLCVFVKLK